MEYLLLMTISGSILFMGYCLWGKCFEKLISQNMKYKALIVVLFVYFIPWVWLKGIYTNVFARLLREVRAEDIEGMVQFADFETELQSYRTEDYRLQLMLLGAWFVGAVMMVLVKSAVYFYRRHSLLSVAMECRDDQLEAVTKRLQEELHCKHMPEIFWICEKYRTLTLGVWKPVIFLQREYEPGELYPILRHEMIHVVRKDLLVKVFMEFVCCLHWFNPLIYLVRHQFDFVCEASCDERVIRGCTNAERVAYGTRLVNNRKGCIQRIPFGNNLGGGRKEIEKRLKLIIGTREVKFWKKAVALCIFGALLLLNSLSALAYPDVYHFEDSSIEVAGDSVEGGNFWVYDFVQEGYDLPTDTILYDEQFVDDSGDIYPIDFNPEESSCINHDMVSGYIQIHTKNNEGGCAVEAYEAVRCPNCGKFSLGDLHTSFEAADCPH